MGLVSGNAAGNLATASDSFNDFKSSVESAKEDLEALKNILSESTSGTGMSSDSVKAFREMFGDDAEKALEKTANGYHLNRKALAELESQQESSNEYAEGSDRITISTRKGALVVVETLPDTPILR